MKLFAPSPYIINCKKCNQNYIGETCHTYRTRILEHTKNVNSNVYRHFINNHNGDNIQENITHKIIGQNFQNSLHRKHREREQIASYKAEINIQNA